MTNLPQLVDAIDTVSMELDEREAAAMGLDLGWNDLTGEEALAYVRLRLEGDDPARSRGYELLMQMLDEIRKKYDLSILMTTHDFSMLPRYCDRVVLLAGGKLIKKGPPLDVLNSDEFARAFHMGGGAE